MAVPSFLAPCEPSSYLYTKRTPFTCIETVAENFRNQVNPALERLEQGLPWRWTWAGHCWWRWEPNRRSPNGEQRPPVGDHVAIQICEGVRWRVGGSKSKQQRRGEEEEEQHSDDQLLPELDQPHCNRGGKKTQTKKKQHRIAHCHSPPSINTYYYHYTQKGGHYLTNLGTIM